MRKEDRGSSLSLVFTLPASNLPTSVSVRSLKRNKTGTIISLPVWDFEKVGSQGIPAMERSLWAMLCNWRWCVHRQMWHADMQNFPLALEQSRGVCPWQPESREVIEWHRTSSSWDFQDWLPDQECIEVMGKDYARGTGDQEWRETYSRMEYRSLTKATIADAMIRSRSCQSDMGQACNKKADTVP